MWCGRSNKVGILNERLRSGPTGGVVEGRPEDQPAYCYQTAENQSSDERLEDWLRDKVTDAAQMTQHGETVHSAAHMCAHHQVTVDKNSQITNGGDRWRKPSQPTLFDHQTDWFQS